MLSRLIEPLILGTQRFKIARQFKKNLGYAGDFENPKSYQEKVQFRKLYGNHEFYGLAADKYRARDYVAAKVGTAHLVPLLGAYDRLDRAVFDSLPDSFIIKANHGCKWHKIVHDKSQLDIDLTVRWFNKLMRRRYGRAAGERHYNFIPPKIIVEELLEGPLGGSPWDYCFFCYRGPNGFDYTFAICSPEGKAASFDKHWNLLRPTDIPEDQLAVHMHPANFELMTHVARQISADFDFVRADLYSVGDKVYFGELTCTPHQGYGRIDDPGQQKMRDELWHLDSANPLLYKAPRAHRLLRPVTLADVPTLARAPRTQAWSGTT